jgi:hypothetical protein
MSDSFVISALWFSFHGFARTDVAREFSSIDRDATFKLCAGAEVLLYERERRAGECQHSRTEELNHLHNAPTISENLWRLFELSQD